MLEVMRLLHNQSGKVVLYPGDRSANILWSLMHHDQVIQSGDWSWSHPIFTVPCSRQLCIKPPQCFYICVAYTDNFSLGHHVDFAFRYFNTIPPCLIHFVPKPGSLFFGGYIFSIYSIFPNISAHTVYCSDITFSNYIVPKYTYWAYKL